MLDNMLYGHADDFTLVTVVPFPGGDQNRVNKWYDLGGIKVTIHPQSTTLSLDGKISIS